MYTMEWEVETKEKYTVLIVGGLALIAELYCTNHKDMGRASNTVKQTTVQF